jgi:hypothetical protein
LFVHQGYQHLTRVPLPAGEHRLRRVWVLPAAAGTLLVEIYSESALQTPTERIFEGTVEVAPGDVGHDAQGPWSVLELPALAAPAQAVWVGFRKKNGTPALWSSAAARAGAFLRSVDPTDPLDLLPLKHGAVFSLDVSP